MKKPNPGQGRGIISQDEIMRERWDNAVRHLLANKPNPPWEFSSINGDIQIFVQPNLDDSHGYMNGKMCFAVLRVDNHHFPKMPEYQFVKASDITHTGLKMFISQRDISHLYTAYKGEPTTVKRVVVTGYSKSGRSGFIDILEW